MKKIIILTILFASFFKSDAMLKLFKKKFSTQKKERFITVHFMGVKSSEIEVDEKIKLSILVKGAEAKELSYSDRFQFIQPVNNQIIFKINEKMSNKIIITHDLINTPEELLIVDKKTQYVAFAIHDVGEGPFFLTSQYKNIPH